MKTPSSNRLLWLFSIALTAGMIASCSLKGLKKAMGIPVPKNKLEYVGYWSSFMADTNILSFDDVSLEIRESGRIKYERSKFLGGTRSFSGPLQRFEGDDFVMGSLGIYKRFDVTRPPHMEEDSTWHMTVNGIELVRF